MRLQKKVIKSTPQKYAVRKLRFVLDNGTRVDVEAVNTLDAERQLKEASITTDRIVRIDFDPADFCCKAKPYLV